MKNFGTHITSWVAILLLLTGSILYPYWIVKGYLENWYLIISVFIACYGGLIGNIFGIRTLLKTINDIYRFFIVHTIGYV